MWLRAQKFCFAIHLPIQLSLTCKGSHFKLWGVLRATDLNYINALDPAEGPNALVIGAVQFRPSPRELWGTYSQPDTAE